MTAIIILFNTDKFITEQIRLLQKYVTDKIAVVDNSSDYAIAEKVKEICYENKVEYLKTFCDETDFSKSHAYACTIAINLFRNMDESILLLDHDIFPLREFDKPAEEIILAGIAQIRTSAKHITDDSGKRYIFTYLWPGLLYINTRALVLNEINVKPCIVMETFLDTGGGLYSLTAGNPDRIRYYNEQHQEFTLNDKKDIYSIIENGAWMHFQRGSNWANSEYHEERISYLMSILYANT